jgi:hypothetical protein
MEKPNYSKGKTCPVTPHFCGAVTGRSRVFTGVHIPAHPEQPFWFNVNTYSGSI